MNLWTKGNPSKYLGNERRYLTKVLNSENWSATGGSWNGTLEREFALRHGKKYAVSMNSGTATLHAALEAVGVGPGDEVIVPALTVIMNSTSVFHANAIPVYADVEEDTFNMDPKSLQALITPKTKAIVVVALYGLPADMDAIMEIAIQNGIPVIEDNAQCFLGMYKGKLSGSFGAVSSWSFENTKHISCGEGGIITTDDPVLAERIRKFAGHGFKNLSATEGRVRLNQEVFQNPNYKRHDSIGWNYRLPEFNAAVALAQLERLDELVDLRRKTAETFLNVMQDVDYLVPQYTPIDRVNSYYTLGVKYFGNESIGVSWEDFRKSYIDRGGDGIYGAWSVPYLEPAIAEGTYQSRNPKIYADVKYEQGLCPIAEKIQPTLMQFKTNYRSVKLAEKKAKILRETIVSFKK